ncbi:helix-turn-helix transcriptional regulator [Blastococcus sp. KM273128]|uniref:helix-turn-helix domain-containing protein n=1 Tax=Blastococcus sp. KM273128 TaxID=2570314 RepID=UPI001F1E583A|nr:helix-turn-helix transcriptional regulator [Blastococcus sp. KM273128]MCF6742828.1 helix-turn-helix transcriptional regulator [Blastococcus sp. KM273128]
MDPLRLGRDAADRRAWEDACTQLGAADDQGRLHDAEDLLRFGLSAQLTRRDAVAEDAWERAYEAFLQRGDALAAARCAFWLGLVLVSVHGAEARGSGWIARAQRVLEEGAPRDCAEWGYLLLPAGLGELERGDPAAAHRAFARATATGRRCGDVDLATLGCLGQGQALIRSGAAARGMAHLDEAMVAVRAGHVSPIAAGIVYCAVVLACHQVLDLRRAQEWTADLAGWCDAQPGLVPFRGQCLVHRAELAQWRGDWAEALREADRACRWLCDPPDPAAGMAHYRLAELHRVRGDEAAAEAAFEQAVALGHDPHPGLALLRLAQGRTGAAVAAIRCALDRPSLGGDGVVDEVRAPRPRTELLAAGVEILLDAGDVAAAGTASVELGGIADAVGTSALRATAARARGAVALAERRYAPALDHLSAALARWSALGAPYEAARTRVLVGRALRGLGDEDTAAMEVGTARGVFQAVGAAPDLERLCARPRTAGLTEREVDVIRLVAQGCTNREIAARLVISDKTVARHLHNVFTKLALPNRSAATAWAYEHHLV